MPHPRNTILKNSLNGSILNSKIFFFSIFVVIMSMALAVNVDKKPMLPAIVSGLKALFHDPTEPFWTGRVMDLLYDGIPIDCSSDEFSAKAICAQFDNPDMKAMRKLNDTAFAFSLFDGVSSC